MRMRIVRLTLFLALLGAAGPAGCRSVSGGAAERERAVYAAVLDRTVGAPRPWRIAVADSTIALPRTDRATARDWIARYDSVPAELRERLGAMRAARRPSTSLHLPQRAAYFSGAEIRALNESGFWVGVRLTATRSRAIEALTPVAFSADGTQAFVYVEHYCGALCGSGAAVWLVQEPAGQWRVRMVIPFWAS